MKERFCRILLHLSCHFGLLFVVVGFGDYFPLEYCNLDYGMRRRTRKYIWWWESSPGFISLTDSTSTYCIHQQQWLFHYLQMSILPTSHHGIIISCKRLSYFPTKFIADRWNSDSIVVLVHKILIASNYHDTEAPSILAKI